VFAVLGAHVEAATLGPSATTGGASGVSATSATVTGTVNPQGQDTHYHFEYGTTTAYGAKTPPADAGSGLTNVSVSAAISGLSPHTTYHYRLVATNVLGMTANGGDKTFTTNIATPVVTTGGATSVATTSVTLTGSVNPEGQSTTYHFEYGQTTAYGNQTPDASAGSGTATVNASASIGGLSPNTTYHYRLFASNAIGPKAGADKTFTTRATHPPGVSTGGAASIRTTSANLTGSINPQGQSTTYYFQYGTTTSYGSQPSPNSAGDGTAYTGVSVAVGGLSPRTTYHYRLVATNATGTSFGADKTFTTASVPTTPPPVAKTGGAQGVTATSATLTGTANPKGTATTYYFQYGATAAYGSVTPSGNAGSGSRDVSVSAALSGLARNTTYHYRLIVTNAGGTSFGADRTFATAPPLGVLLNASRETVVAGQATTLSGVMLGPGSLRTTVTLQRATSARGRFVNARTTTSADDGTFTFSGLKPSRTTWFRAIGAGGTSAAVRVVVRFRVTLLASTASRYGRQGVRLHGVVAPSHNRRRVLLQKLGAGHRWHTISRPRLHRTPGNLSAYSVILSVGQRGLWRAVVTPDAGHARGFSRMLQIRLGTA
jgi:phosphodiesterase/alkaline phosphatase D-like protein